MRKICCLALGALLVGGPVLAQPAPATSPTMNPAPMRHPTGVVPNDKGPNTPNANAAYMGGGMILQGAPGARRRRRAGTDDAGADAEEHGADAVAHAGAADRSCGPGSVGPGVLGVMS